MVDDRGRRRPPLRLVDTDAAVVADQCQAIPTLLDHEADQLLDHVTAPPLVGRLASAIGPVLAAMFGVDRDRADTMFAAFARGERVRLVVDVMLTEEHVEALEAFVPKEGGHG